MIAAGILDDRRVELLNHRYCRLTQAHGGSDRTLTREFVETWI